MRVGDVLVSEARIRARKFQLPGIAPHLGVVVLHPRVLEAYDGFGGCERDHERNREAQGSEE